MPPRPDISPSRQSAAPLVRTENGRRTLEFMAGNVQSEMLLADPDALVLDYTRAIMCLALFVPRPRHILMVGLGGGSLAKFCYRHLPDTRITVLELRADVIALRDSFAVPPDDARFRVIHTDACAWLAAGLPEPGARPDAARPDVIIVDGFDESGLPRALGTARFYGDCRRALADGGLLVANIFSYDPAYPGVLARLRLMFDDRVCWFDKVAGNNRILFAVKAAIASPDGVPRPRALKVQRLVARMNGSGIGLLNRWIVAFVIRKLARKGA